MAALGADDDHDMDDASDNDDENSKGDIHNNEGDSHMNGHDETAAESSTPTDYSLYDIPPRLAILRQHLHNLEQPLELPKVDFEVMLPYMDNVWRKLKSSEQTEASANTDLYWCKLRKATGQKVHLPRTTPEGKQPRKRKPKEDKACNMSMRVTYSSGAVEKVIITKGAVGEQHSHDLDFMDAQKRNSGIMNTARKEAIKGFQPASIWWKMKEEPDKLDASGGKFMKISDVRNVQYPWRQDHPEVALKAHTGYNAAKAGPKAGQSHGTTRRKSSPRTAIVQPAQLPPPSVYQPPPQPQPVPQSQAQIVHPPPPYQHPPPAPQVLTDILYYPPELRDFLIPFLPNPNPTTSQHRPHVTLTWAQSLDGRIASSPGYRTALSGAETKAMTHFLRSTHDAILIGVRTAIADDPSLNCRLSGAGGYGGPHTQWQPRPIIIDPTGRLIIRPEMKILRVAKEGRAKAPWIVVGPNVNLHHVAVATLKSFGGEYLMINDVDQNGRFSWEGVFQVLHREGIRSIMVEGGGAVLSELLKKRYATSVDSVIITVAPSFLGHEGVQVSQMTEYDAHRTILQTRLKDVFWQAIPGTSGDAVMCGRLEQPSKSNGILQGIVEMANTDAESERQKHAPPPPNRPYQEQQRLPPISQLPPPSQHPQPRPPPPPPQHASPQPARSQHQHPQDHTRSQYPPASHHPQPHPPAGHAPPPHRYQNSYLASPQQPPAKSPQGLKQSPKANMSPPPPHARR